MNPGRARRHALLAFAGAATTLLGVTTGLSGCDQSGGQGAAGVSPFKGAKLQPVFVTVDPERDTAAVLKPYLANFGSDFIALRGESEQIKNLAKSFKVFYAKVPGKSDANNYTMDHSAAVYLFDTEGRVRVYERYGTPVEALTNDVKVLLAGR
jgi:cytochrome oxidase Cu insertion factor (SCO1/SenC/PrrC family)